MQLKLHKSQEYYIFEKPNLKHKTPSLRICPLFNEKIVMYVAGTCNTSLLLLFREPFLNEKLMILVSGFQVLARKRLKVLRTL